MILSKIVLITVLLSPLLTLAHEKVVIIPLAGDDMEPVCRLVGNEVDCMPVRKSTLTLNLSLDCSVLNVDETSENVIYTPIYTYDDVLVLPNDFSNTPSPVGNDIRITLNGSYSSDGYIVTVAANETSSMGINVESTLYLDVTNVTAVDCIAATESFNKEIYTNANGLMFEVYPVFESNASNEVTLKELIFRFLP